MKWVTIVQCQLFYKVVYHHRLWSSTSPGLSVEYFSGKILYEKFNIIFATSNPHDILLKSLYQCMHVTPSYSFTFSTSAPSNFTVSLYLSFTLRFYSASTDFHSSSLQNIHLSKFSSSFLFSLEITLSSANIIIQTPVFLICQTVHYYCKQEA